jgi:hypothetical protein
MQMAPGLDFLWTWLLFLLQNLEIMLPSEGFVVEISLQWDYCVCQEVEHQTVSCYVHSSECGMHELRAVMLWW